MSNWIKSYQALRLHPKKDHLAELLFNGTTPNDVSDYAALGLLHALWWWTLEYAPDGDLSHFSDRQIARGCGWLGDPTALMQSLTAAGFVDQDRSIHDWDEYGGLLIERRSRNAEYMRKARGHHVDTTLETRGGLEKRREEKRKIKVKSVLSDSDEPDDAINNVVSVDNSTLQRDFEHWWTTFGKVGSKADARELYVWWCAHGADPRELLAAATAYRDHCAATDCKMQHARTFLAKKPNRWSEWSTGEEHGGMDAAGAQRAQDVFDTSLDAFSGVLGGTHGRSRYPGNGSRPAGVAPSGADARRSLPAGELETGE